MALRFNDQSVLENHHCFRLFTITRDYDVFEGLTNAQRKQTRKVIIRNILATDMTCHFGLTEELKGVVTRYENAQAEAAGADGAGAGAGASSGGDGNGADKGSRNLAGKVVPYSAVRCAIVRDVCSR